MKKSYEIEKLRNIKHGYTVSAEKGKYSSADTEFVLIGKGTALMDEINESNQFVAAVEQLKAQKIEIKLESDNKLILIDNIIQKFQLASHIGSEN